MAIYPFNPYRGLIESCRRGGRPEAVAALSEGERRVLVAFYDPVNRRRASFYVWAVGLGALFTWLLSLTVLTRPIGKYEMAPGALAFSLTLFGLGVAGWVAMFGLTYGIRAKWDEITSKGLVWPSEIEYPGPLREAVRSFFTGQLPDFIVASQRTPEALFPDPA